MDGNWGITLTVKIITFIVVGLIILIIALVYRRSQAKKQGRLTSRQDVRKAYRVMGRKLKRLAFFRHWQVLSDLSLHTKKEIVHIDFLVIAPFGLLVLTVRGDKGEVYASLNDSRWMHVNGPKKEYLPNLVRQNRIRQDQLRWILSTEKIYKVPIYTLAVFTEPKLELYFPANESSVLHKKKLRKELKQPQYQAILPVDSERIRCAIEKYREIH